MDMIRQSGTESALASAVPVPKGKLDPLVPRLWEIGRSAPHARQLNA